MLGNTDFICPISGWFRNVEHRFRLYDFEYSMVFYNDRGETDTISILIVAKLGDQKPTDTVSLQTLVPHNHLTRHHNLGKLVAKMRRKCPRMPSEIFRRHFFDN